MNITKNDMSIEDLKKIIDFKFNSLANSIDKFSLEEIEKYFKLLTIYMSFELSSDAQRLLIIIIDKLFAKYITRIEKNE